MADPLTLGLTLLSGAMSAMGSIAQGQAAKDQADYQAAVARQNQQIANQYADQELQKGNAEYENQERKTRAALGAQLSAQGASGLDVNSGSLVDIRQSTAELGKLDSLTTYNNAEKSAYGYKVKATSFANDAQLYDMKGDNAQMAGWIGAGSSLLGAATSFSSKWSTMKSLGTTPNLFGV